MSAEPVQDPTDAAGGSTPVPAEPGISTTEHSFDEEPMDLDHRQFDLVIYGATGFTGKRVARYVARRFGPSGQLFGTGERRGLRWAIAGRSTTRLEEVRRWLVDEHCRSTGIESTSPDADPVAADLATLPILVADARDAESLAGLFSRARLAINCVGPFRFFGEPIVSACARVGTHYVDITGEPQFIESMKLRHDREAQATGARIVHACGFDSMAADLGVLFAAREMEKLLMKPSTVESFLSLSCGPAGMRGHFTTWESAVHGFHDRATLSQVRKQLDAVLPRTVPHLGPKLVVRRSQFHDDRVGRWCVPFPGSDASVVRMSQKLQFQNDPAASLPPQYAAYYAVSSSMWLLFGAVIGTMFDWLSRGRIGRELLLRFPRLFSGGVFSHDGPSEAQMRDTSFRMQFFGHAYSAGNKDYTQPPDAEVVTVVTGPEPGYVATPIFVVEAALTLLEETDEIRSGVMTPGAAFKNTAIIERIHAAGIRFDVVSHC